MLRQLSVLFVFTLLWVARTDAQAPGARGGGARGAQVPSENPVGLGTVELTLIVI